MSRIVLTTGTFNLITPAHVDFLARAREHGSSLVVFLDSDERNKELKPDKCFYTFEERKTILSSIRYVDRVIKLETFDSIDKEVKKIRDRSYNLEFLFLKGRDYDMSTIDPDLLKILDKNNILVSFLPLKEGYSTTKLVEKIRMENL